MTFFTKAARKSQMAGMVSFLAPLLMYLNSQDEWSWRAFAGAVVSGLIGGITVFYTTNFPPVPAIDKYANLRRRGRDPQ